MTTELKNPAYYWSSALPAFVDFEVEVRDPGRWYYHPAALEGGPVVALWEVARIKEYLAYVNKWGWVNHSSNESKGSSLLMRDLYISRDDPDMQAGHIVMASIAEHRRKRDMVPSSFWGDWSLLFSQVELDLVGRGVQRPHHWLKSLSALVARDWRLAVKPFGVDSVYALAEADWALCCLGKVPVCIHNRCIEECDQRRDESFHKASLCLEEMVTGKGGSQ
jgi:hypothetical protein